MLSFINHFRHRHHYIRISLHAHNNIVIHFDLTYSIFVHIYTAPNHKLISHIIYIYTLLNTNVFNGIMLGEHCTYQKQRETYRENSRYIIPYEFLIYGHSFFIQSNPVSSPLSYADSHSLKCLVKVKLYHRTMHSKNLSVPCL